MIGAYLLAITITLWGWWYGEYTCNDEFREFWDTPSPMSEDSDYFINYDMYE